MLELEQLAAPAFSVTVGADGTFRYRNVNAANTARTGLTRDAVVGRTPHDLYPADVADRMCEQYRNCVEQRRMVEYETAATLPTGEAWWRTSLMPALDGRGTVERLIGVCHDITSQKRLERDLQEINAQLDIALRCLKGADWRFDVSRGAFEASPNIALLMGESRPRPVPWSEWAARVLPEDRAGVSCESLLAGDSAEQVVRFRFRDNRDVVRWAQCRRLVASEGRSTPVICGVIIDITDERHREMILEAEAERDSLTGLLNRRGFKKSADRLLSADPAPGGLAVLMLDLDGFKLTNDRHGHAAGDAVLIEVARRLVAEAGDEAVLARLGGDEFIVAVPSLSQAGAEALRSRVEQRLGQSLRTARTWVGIGGSVGLAWREATADLSTMMADADEQLYRQKRARKLADADRARIDATQLALFAT